VSRGITWKDVETQSGVSMQEFYGAPSATKTGFRRSTVAKLADFFDSAKLRAVSTSDVFWDRVVSIEYVGVEDTYDLTVEEDHNFVADGLIVHNSHTAAYGMIGYQTAYLKTHYTAEFMAALLSSEIDDGNKRDIMVDHIADARKLGVDVEPPNVNKGQPDFDVVNGKIVFGLTALKGLGRGAAEEVVKARDRGGPFRDLFDFCNRVDLRVVKPVQIEKLIKGGAMDCFSKNRKALVLTVERAINAAQDSQEDRRRGQKNLFAGDDDAGDATTPGGLPANGALLDVEPWPDLEKLKFEKEVLDFYMSSHPLAQYDEQLRRFRGSDAAACAKLNAGTEVRLAGMVVEVIPKLVSKGKNAGNRWAIVRIEDFSGSVKCILWSDQFQRFGDLVKADAILLFDGKVEWREGSGEPDVIVDKVMTMEQAKAELTRGLVLRMKFRTDDDGRQTFDSLGKILKKAKGPCPVYLAVQDAGGRAAQFKLSQDYFVNPTQVAVEQLEMILGPGAVLFTSR
jgi:DNA polymerase III subunit alpha